MIASRDRSTAKDAGHDFNQWASLFSEGLFVILRVYGDESGTSDIAGQQPGNITTNPVIHVAEGFFITPNVAINWIETLQ